MARYRISSPDGKQTIHVEGPDDATPDELQEFARQQFGGAYSNAQVKVNAPAVDPEDELISGVGEGVSEIGNGILAGGANVLDHAADWAQSGLNAVGNAVGVGALGDKINGAWGNGQNDLSAAVPQAREGLGTLRGVGNFIGETAATLPVGLLRGGALVQGAVGGALLSNSNDAVGVGLDAATGAAGGYIGNKLLRGASALAAPPENEGLRTLIDAGTRVTPGQYGRAVGGKFGQSLARSEDRAVSTPFIGDRIVGDRNQSLGDFARATINRAVDPIGLRLPDNISPGRSAVKWAGDKLSNAYDELLPNLRVSGDEQFLTELQSIHADAQTLTTDRIGQFDRTLQQLGRFWNNGGELSGQNLKAIDTRLGERIRKLSGSQSADEQDLGDAFQSVRDAVHDLAARQNPDYAEQLQNINRGWKGLVQVEKASANSKASITPAGYSQAVKQTSDTVRRRGYARGEALNQDLSDAASDILPSEIADSGTAGRAAQSNMIYLGMGAAQVPLYEASKRAIPLLTRDQYISPQLARLLQYGAAAAPAAAPAAIQQIRQ